MTDAERGALLAIVGDLEVCRRRHVQREAALTARVLELEALLAEARGEEPDETMPGGGEPRDR